MTLTIIIAIWLTGIPVTYFILRVLEPYLFDPNTNDASDTIPYISAGWPVTIPLIYLLGAISKFFTLLDKWAEKCRERISNKRVK